MAAFVLSAVALTGCTSTCQEIYNSTESLAQKCGGTIPAPACVSSCQSAYNGCSSADQTTLDNFGTCWSKINTCNDTADQESCEDQLKNLSAACTATLGSDLASTCTG